MPFELSGSELLSVEQIETSVQVATIKSTVEVVTGYDQEEPIIFETIPERPEGDYQLHYEDGALVWKPIVS